MQVTRPTSLSPWVSEVVSGVIEDPLKKRLELLGWKDVSPQTHLGVEFDLVGHRRFSFLTKWNVLVKYIDVVDNEEVQRWTASFQRINEESKNPLDERCFLLCLIAGKVESDLEELIKAREPFGLASVVQRFLDASSCRGGGGNIFVVDLASRTIHGTVPWLPYDVRKYSQELQAFFRGVFADE
jgi:hypothetical protein